MEVLVIIISIAVLYLILDGGRILEMKPSMNEATLGKLFRWRKKVEYNGVSFYIRIVSDSTVEDARRYALIAARRLRRELRDENSDDYLLQLDPYNDYTKEELSGFIQLSASREIMRSYLSNNPKPQLADLPSTPTQEQMEEREAEIAERDDDYIKAMQEYVEGWRVDFEKQLASREMDVLLSMARRYRIDELCENLFSHEFESYVIASSIYTDEKYTKRMMSIEDYKELPTEVQQLLYDAYNNMNTTVDEIKNS